MNARDKSIAQVDAALSKLAGDYLGELQRRAKNVGESPPLPPGPGLKWVRVDDDFVAREAARLGAWKQAELAKFIRFYDAPREAA